MKYLLMLLSLSAYALEKEVIPGAINAPLEVVRHEVCLETLENGELVYTEGDCGND